MSPKFLRLACAGLLLTALTARADTPRPDADWIFTHLREMVRSHPEMSLGAEVVHGLNQTIHDPAKIAQMRQDWPSAARVIAAETDYELQISGSHILLLPKADPARDDAPLTPRRIHLAKDLTQWTRLGEIQTPENFPDLPVRLAMYGDSISDPADDPLAWRSDLLPAARKIMQENQAGGAPLTDILFLTTRATGAHAWCVTLIPNIKTNPPRKLIFGILTFYQ